MIHDSKIDINFTLSRWLIVLLFFTLQNPFSFTQSLNLSLQTGHTGSITKVAFDPTNNYLVTSGTDHLVILWDVKANRQIKPFLLHNATVNDFDIHPTKKWIASGSDDQTVKIWEYPSGNIIHEFNDFEQFCN